MTQILNPDSQDPIVTINVMRVFSYDVSSIVLFLQNDVGLTDVTIDDVMDYLESVVHEDFSRDDTKDLIFTDNNGDQL